MPTFVSPFTGDVVQPTDVSYYALSFSSNTQLYWPAVVNGSDTPAARIIDCVASTGGLTILLPDATQGAVGEDILFRNLGANTFTITDANGGGSVSVTAGTSKYFYLIDNTTLGGTWNNVTFGAGTSYADAATLQGAGLTTVAGKLATTQVVTDVSVAPTLTDSSRATIYNWTSGNGSITLPAPSTLSTGWFIGFRNSGSGSLQFSATLPALINDTSTVTVNPGDSGYIVYDSTTGQFITIGLTAAASVSFTAATYDVNVIPGTTLDLTAYAPIIQTYIAQSGDRVDPLTVYLPTITQIYILANDTTAGSATLSFEISGFPASNLPVLYGEVVVVLSDGTNLYPLTQSTTGLFYAQDGTANLPSFSFSNDTHTGMYLPGTSILGFAANGVQIMNIDNSTPSAPLTTFAGQVDATLTLVAGGTF